MSKAFSLSRVGFVLFNISPFLLFFVEHTSVDWLICISLYVIRMFFVTAGYHRYFSHRAYKTGRFFQFILAFFAETSVQKGVLWWSAHHRKHHKYSDQDQDVHSPIKTNFWYSHVGWILNKENDPTDYDMVKDFKKFPELLWLNTYHYFPPVVLGVSVFFLGLYLHGTVMAAFTTLLIGFFVSTFFLYHFTFFINSLAHVFGYKRLPSNDDSKNNFILALFTLGEGWHNNHHFYAKSVRQGFKWWEIDITYMILYMLSWFGIVYDLRPVPKDIDKRAEILKERYRKT